MNTNTNTNMNSTTTSSTYTSTSGMTAPIVQQVMLPTQVIEKPVAVHEEIRRETIEEVQPVYNVEKLKTEIHQISQPLFDKEVKSVSVSQRTLATEVLPEVTTASRGTYQGSDVSTTKYLDTATVVIEKPAMYMEIEKKQIINEIQPVIYKETVVPTVIQETKPMYQKVVEGPVYSQQVLPGQQANIQRAAVDTYVPNMTATAPVMERVMLPAQVVEKPIAIHEEIRRETIEEIQPVVNVEKIKTEIHQITAPLFDKEVRAVNVEQRTLASETLPEVFVQGRGTALASDVSTTVYMDTQTRVIEKPAMYSEVERTQVIEEIQPVLYKETVVPTVIRETKPMYQKIVEGPVYIQETLPARSLHDSGYTMPAQQPIVMPVQQPIVVPVVREVLVPVVVERTIPISAPAPAPLPVQHGLHNKVIIETTETVTTTTSVAPTVGGSNASSSRGSHSSTGPVQSTNTANSNVVSSTHNTHMDRHGHKVVEDTTVTSTTTSNVVPAKRM